MGEVGPGIKESAGRKKGYGATGHGNPYLARALGEAAVGASRTPTFHDLGPDWYDSRVNLNRTMRSHVRALHNLGYRVTLEPVD